MDPDANLAEQLGLARGIVQFAEDHDPQAVRLAELVVSLHEWIDRGGFLPAAWQATAGAGPIAGCDANGEPTLKLGHEFEPMPGDDVCMAVNSDDKYTRCMKFEDEH
ncbi:hypothetical protein SEA_DONNY_87 [Mycobacterium phage Donny]|uniref:Uncharacterized protein n=1 Tax=Mycobacterium phage Donny TaxID=2530126 RepID=A0A481VRM8_9CAUD|nr:hypothetical protein SEA_DONNY_87 [Mycobacterium phage Donny]